jgi:hypothetical protein
MNSETTLVNAGKRLAGPTMLNRQKFLLFLGPPGWLIALLLFIIGIVAVVGHVAIGHVHLSIVRSDCGTHRRVVHGESNDANSHVGGNP